ncbi:hypothetical protein BsWGS_00791 [Bradybaena similaris]
MEVKGLLLTLPRTLLLLVIMLFSSLQAQQCDTVTSLGLADPNIIPNSKIVTSSEAEGHGKEQIRLNCCEGTYDSAWCPDPKDKQPFVEIHLDKPVSIGEIDIQAPKMSQTTLRYPDNYMKTFDLVIKLAGINQLVSVAQNVSAIANASVSLNRISLYPTVFTDVIRIEPRDSENLPCFRMELFQCEATSMCPRNFCQNNGTCSQPNMCDCPDAYYGERCQYSKESIPLTVYKFLQIIGDTIVTASHNLTFYGNMSLENQSVLVVQPGGYLNLLDFSQSSCFSDLDKCTSGFTINIVFSISHLDTNSIVVLSNGGADDSRIRGITLLFQQGNIHCYASTSEKLWTVVTQFTLAEATWYKMTISWSLNLGLIVLQDRELVGSTFIPQTLDTPASRTNLLRLGNWEETSTSVLHFKGITMVPLDWQEFQRADLDKVDEDNFIDRYWDLRGISQLVIESHNWYLNLIGKPAFGEDGVTLTRIDQFIEIADIGSSCLTDPSLCTDGLTLKITIKLATIEEDSIIFTTGGEYKNHPGVTLLYRYGQFHAIVSTESLSWFVSVSRTTILTRDFCDIILSWSQHKSLKLIINQVLVGESASPIPHTNTTLPYIDKLTIGIGITECVISELHIWHSHVELLSQRGLIFCIPCSTPPTTSVTTAQTQPSTSAQSTGKTTREAPWFTDSTTEETTPYYYEDECPPGCVASDICFQVPETPSPEPTPSCDLTTQGSSPTTTAEDATTQQKITTASTVTKSTPPRSTPTLPSLTTRASTTTSTSIPPSSVTLIPEVSSSGQGLLICSVSAAPEPGIKIKFTWTIEGSSVQWSKEIEAPERSASISAAEINVQILNRAITCTAEVRYSTPNAEWCWPERSNVVVPSIKCPPVNGTIRVIEGREEQILQVQVTVPPSLLCRPEDGGQCRVEVTTTITTTSNELKCSAKEIIPQAVLGVSTVGQSGTQSCGVAITSGNWQNAVTIPIKATVDGVIDGNRNRKLQISVRIIGQITSITSFETCGEIDVIVIDRGDGATCSSVNDPHIKSWDNLRYNNFLPGEFVLANHKYLQYEVRALYSPCNPRQPKGATCNCGAAVRSGDDVITFDTCNTRQNQITSGGTSVITVDMYKNGELTPGTRVIRHGCGQKYEVVLPTRTKVVITSSVKPFLNINLQASSYDFESTEGLCGDFNNNPSDDLGGLNIKNPDAFNKQWLRNVTIFKGVPAFTTPARPTFCSCQSGQQPVCKPGLDVYICYAAATEANDITAALVSQAKTPLVLSQVRTSLFQVQSRGRRAVDTTNLQNPAASSVVTGFTSETALQYCQEYLENSTAVQNCLSHLKYDTLNESIRNCVEDLTADNDTQWATSHVDDLIVECLADVQANITTWENNENEDGPNIPQYINSSLCTQNCGEHGSCINSICECKEGWTGETCQIGSATTPTVLSAMLACDVMTASCNRILVEGNNFVSTKNLTCRIRYITVGDKVSVTGEEYTVPAIFISMIQVVCPENIASSLQSRSALVTLSNNGVTYSETNHIHIVQKSTCQTCTLRDDVSAVSCTWNPGSCVIDNKCYARFEPFEANTCYRCDPDVSLNKWTKISDPNCTLTQPEVGEFVTEPADNTTIIALGVVCGVLVLVAVGVIIAVVVRSRRRSSKLQRLWEGDPSLDIYHRRAIPSSADVSGQSDAARINAFYNPALSSSIDVSTN